MTEGPKGTATKKKKTVLALDFEVGANTVPSYFLVDSKVVLRGELIRKSNGSQSNA